MTEWKIPTQKEFVSRHRSQDYRRFRCTGSCGTEIEALAAAELWCGQPGCRGSMKPSYPVSSRRLAIEQFNSARRRDETPRFTPHFLGVLAFERPWKAPNDRVTHEGDLGGLIAGIAQAQELLIDALICAPDGQWCWAPGVKDPR